eukprot:CAMPEP_0206325162 /NCGR_PEP_ID=MMETSP0106_2-20121207/20917_1 /ASSEMBLY_ACC=CAM_ASM_000206 /TAXON_ID=81532 /ORGANISM="Acanthoeca-like sp., Strain 10tr" /LENGTH=174 /DNA_ID=CAMNT_0053757593 /DNA_START=44 /DNA_END=566 /DNA_ORIENTATION=-
MARRLARYAGAVAAAACTIAILEHVRQVAVTVNASPASGMQYTLEVDGAGWLQSGPIAVTSGLAVWSTSPNCTPRCLQMAAAATHTTGSDSNGAYTEVTVPWTGDGGQLRFETAFRAYAELPVLVFEQRFPSGVTGLAHIDGAFPAHGVSTAFPSWATETTVNGGLGVFSTSGQ